MRDVIAEIVEALVVRHEATRRIDLNDITEVIGERAVSYEDVELIVSELEGRGCAVAGPPTAVELRVLGEVIATIRDFAAERGRRPSVPEIAAVIGRPAFVVRRAWWAKRHRW